jgi:hypothetical protein
MLQKVLSRGQNWQLSPNFWSEEMTGGVTVTKKAWKVIKEQMKAPSPSDVEGAW